MPTPSRSVRVADKKEVSTSGRDSGLGLAERRAEGKCHEVGRGSRGDSSPPSTLAFQEVGLQHHHHQQHHLRSRRQHRPPGPSRMAPPPRRRSFRKGGARPGVGILPLPEWIVRAPDSEHSQLSNFSSQGPRN